MSEQDTLERRCQELESINGLMRELLKLEDYDEMLDAVLQHSLTILDADRGFLVLKHGDALDFKVVRNWNREELEAGTEQVSRTLLHEVLERRQPLLVEDALTDQRFGDQASVQRLRIRSVLAAPVCIDDELVGALYLESRSLERFFHRRQLGLFETLLEVSSRALQTGLNQLALKQRNSLLETDFLARHKFPGIVTRDSAFLRVLETVAQVAQAELPLLVQGPSGCGKELVVRALHLNSPRAHKPLVTINCGAIAPNLLESELFGHVRGAFTGAVRDKPGLIPSGDGGTVFLDEIAELPLELQSKLLRTVQFGEVQPVGSTKTQTVNVRFVAATHRDLFEEVADGRFREDLVYRLNAVTLHIPALCERPDDILLLFHHFLQRGCTEQGRPVPEVPADFEAALQGFRWPGNVRELENEAARQLAITPPGQPLSPERMSPRILDAAKNGSAPLPTLLEQERRLIEHQLRQAGGNRTHAAKQLGISRETLRQKIKRYGLS